MNGQGYGNVTARHPCTCRSNQASRGDASAHGVVVARAVPTFATTILGAAYSCLTVYSQRVTKSRSPRQHTRRRTGIATRYVQQELPRPPVSELTARPDIVAQHYVSVHIHLHTRLRIYYHHASTIHHLRDFLRLAVPIDCERSDLEAAGEVAMLVRRRLLMLHHSLHRDVRA